MFHRMNEFAAIDPAHVATLRDAGIENTDDMMRTWADQTKRPALMEKTGIGEEQFTRFVAMCRLARVKHVGPKYVEVLLAAGIDGPRSLFESEPAALAKRLWEVKLEKGLTGPVPPITEIETWFKDPVPGKVATV
jgi:hypothetical protein